MSDQINEWPKKIQARTTDEWMAIAGDWTASNRTLVLEALKALNVQAMTYARLNDPKDRVAIIMKEQERLLGAESLTGKKAAATTAPKTAAPKAAGTGTAGASAGGGPGNAAVMAKLEELSGQVTELQQILKLMLLAPANAEALALAADADTANDIGSKTLQELAAGNG